MLDRILSLNELPTGSPRLVNAGGRDLLVIRCGERVYATGALCPHRGAPLKDGIVIEGLIVCPWHRSAFNLGSGHPVCGPCKQPLVVWKAEIQNGEVLVDLSTASG